MLRHASSSCRACSMSRGIADALAGFINRSSLPSSGRPTDISRTAQVKLSSLAANSQRIDDVHYRVTGNGEVFSLEVSLHPSAGAVDYIREMPNGNRGGAYIRVTPRPLGGSTITMTVPVGANTIETDVAKVLEQELADLIQLAQI